MSDLGSRVAEGQKLHYVVLAGLDVELAVDQGVPDLNGYGIRAFDALLLGVQMLYFACHCQAFNPMKVPFNPDFLRASEFFLPKATRALGAGAACFLCPSFL